MEYMFFFFLTSIWILQNIDLPWITFIWFLRNIIYFSHKYFIKFKLEFTKYSKNWRGHHSNFRKMWEYLFGVNIKFLNIDVKNHLSLSWNPLNNEVKMMAQMPNNFFTSFFHIPRHINFRLYNLNNKITS